MWCVQWTSRQTHLDDLQLVSGTGSIKHGDLWRQRRSWRAAQLHNNATISSEDVKQLIWGGLVWALDVLLGLTRFRELKHMTKKMKGEKTEYIFILICSHKSDQGPVKQCLCVILHTSNFVLPLPSLAVATLPSVALTTVCVCVRRRSLSLVCQLVPVTFGSSFCFYWWEMTFTTELAQCFVHGTAVTLKQVAGAGSFWSITQRN